MVELLTIEEVANILKMNKEVIRRKIRNKQIKAIKFDRTWRVDTKDLEEYINNKRKEV